MSVTEETVSSEAKIDVAAALIVRNDGKILMVFNDKWGAFTLPMTKRRAHRDETGAVLQEEPWADAAARAAVEALGAPCAVTLVKLPDEPSTMRGKRDGRLKQYRYRVYRVDYDPKGPAPAERPDRISAWLSPDQITAPVGKAPRPLSDSAYLLVNLLRHHAPKVLESGNEIGRRRYSAMLTWPMGEDPI